MKGLNTNGEELAEEILGSLQNMTQEQVYKILSIQDRIHRDSETGKWKIKGKKKHGGHLDLHSFKHTLLKITNI